MSSNSFSPSKRRSIHDAIPDRPNEKKENKETSLCPKDKKAIAILMFLYVLQGIPLGLCGSIPYILTNRGISYQQQALFSFTFWPFSLKLLWAPIVDGLYSKQMGRRKSWLLPIQYFLGFMLIYLSYHVDNLIEGSIKMLTAYFFLLNFGAATQDVAVDGWCLTMLSAKNVGWASTCNTVGQTAGYFLGNVVLQALESKDFSNNYVRNFIGLPHQETGLATLSSFMYFWGIVFLVVTTLVGIFKNERNDEDDLGVIETYQILWKVMKKKMVLIFIAFALTSRIGLSAVDNITGLKLIEKGIPKENLALMAIPLTPIQILLPLLISKYTAGPRPMSVWVKVYIPRLIFGILLAGLVYGSSQIGTILDPENPRESGLDFPLYWYATIIFIYIFHQIIVYCTFVSIMAFNAKISDPEIGGTYMTLLNTVNNLGGNWPATVALYFVDQLSEFNCFESRDLNAKVAQFPKEISTWDDKSLKINCTENGYDFRTVKDGYYTEVLITTILGFIWISYFRKYIYQMDSVDKEEWYASKKKKAQD